MTDPSTIKTLQTFEEHRIPMTDDEFLDYFRGLLADEQQAIDAAVTVGSMFVMSSARKVHTLKCKNSGFLSGRLDAYEQITPELEGIRQQLAHGSPPRLPEFVTLAKLSMQTRKYTRCSICAPGVPEYRAPEKIAETLDTVIEKLRFGAEQRGSKPHQALVAILDLHQVSSGAEVCSCDRETWPCSTVRDVHRVYGLALGD